MLQLLKVFRVTLFLFALMAISFACGVGIGNTDAVIEPFEVAGTIITMSMWTIVFGVVIFLVEMLIRFRRSTTPSEQEEP